MFITLIEIFYSSNSRRKAHKNETCLRFWKSGKIFLALPQVQKYCIKPLMKLSGLLVTGACLFSILMQFTLIGQTAHTCIYNVTVLSSIDCVVYNVCVAPQVLKQ